MPIYEYKCQDCGNDYSDLVSIGGDAPPCSKCGSINVCKKVSKFASVSSSKSEEGGGSGSACSSCSSGSCSTCGL